VAGKGGGLPADGPPHEVCSEKRVEVLTPQYLHPQHHSFHLLYRQLVLYSGRYLPRPCLSTPSLAPSSLLPEHALDNMFTNSKPTNTAMWLIPATCRGLSRPLHRVVRAKIILGSTSSTRSATDLGEKPTKCWTQCRLVSKLPALRPKALGLCIHPRAA
jgi:hypothetical protein